MNVEGLQTKLANHIFRINISPLSTMLTKFYVEVFYQLEEVPSILSLLRAFY